MTTPTETPTPLTDAEQNKLKPFDESFTVWCARGWHFARTLERQLTAATAQLEEARKVFERLLAGFNEKELNELVWKEQGRMAMELSVGEVRLIRQALAAMQQKEGK